MAKQPASLEEETFRGANPNNKLGESDVAEVQRNVKHVPLFCTDMEEHEHLTNHFNEQLNVKILDMFKDLFSNVNVDSIQKTYPKICVYNRIITQYVEDANTKYGLNLKFTKLEALEVCFWAKTFQVAGHHKDQQPPKEQQSEPPIPQPSQPHCQQGQQITQQLAQQMALFMGELQIAEQWVETNKMTSMATQWSHSIPVMSPIAQEQVVQYHASGRAMPKWYRVCKCSGAMPPSDR